MPTASDRTPRFDPVTWRAHWIAPEQLVSPTNLPPGYEPPMGNRGFSRTLFRREFDLESAPAAAPLRITADSRYVLLVNGVEVGRGPVRSQPRRWHYDEYDIAGQLSSGANCLAVIVTYYGEPNSIWQPASASGGVGADALLAVEGWIDGLPFASDSSWRVHRSTAWTQPANRDEGVPVDVEDAREHPVGWQDAGFDDAGWRPAAIAHAVHVGSLARSQPPTNPYGVLASRPIGRLGSEVVEARRVTIARSVALSGFDNDNPADRVRSAAERSGTALDASALPIGARIAEGSGALIEADFGRIVAGTVMVDVAAPAGTVIELHYRETSLDAPGRHRGPRTCARWTVGESGRYRAMEVSGLRFVSLLVHGAAAAEIEVTRLAITERLYPLTGDAAFDCDDPRLVDLYRAGVRTVRLNSFDSFIDCPTREQRAWVGDGVVHELVHLTCSDDWRLARRYVELADSPRPDGMLPMSVVGDFEFGDGYAIPDWALHWLHGLHLLHQYTGDVAALARRMPTAERMLRWFEGYLDASGTVSDVAEWNLIDWGIVFTTGRSSVINALWARGLREYAQLCEIIGNRSGRSWASARYDALAAAFDDFWDENRGVYIDHIEGSVARPAVSQAANAAAIAAGLVPEHRVARVIGYISDRARHVVANSIGPYRSADGTLRDRLRDQLGGRLEITWDPQRQVVRAEPFFSYVVHDAYAAAGRTDLIIDALSDWTRFLHDGYDTFGECWEQGTHVHGWSATPSRDLIQHIVGVTPASPGFEAVRIAPRLGQLTRVDARVPTPHGSVHVRVDEAGIVIDSPVPAIVDLEDGTVRHLEAGSSIIPAARMRLPEPC